jgi:CheY-like chemotaxis protein
VSVSDNGIGMTPEIAKHVFEPFFTTKDKTTGAGLGLSIVYGIVKQSGGYISVNSTPQQGSTFKVFLPVAAELPEAHDEQTVSQALPKTGGGETILIVEDEERIATVLGMVLENAGYTVLKAITAQDGLDIAHAYKGQIDLMLTDIMLRGTMAGTELADAIQSVRPATKIMFMSGYSDSLIGEDSRYSNYTLLRKPFSMRELHARVRGLLD